MKQNISKNLIIIVILTVVIAGLSGCGKNLETPAPAATTTTDTNQTATPAQATTTTKTTCGENEQTIFLKDEEMDTNNWVTYRNEKYGYELKYPDTWKMDSLTDDFILNSKDYRNVFGVLIRATNENPDNLDIQEWIKNFPWKGWDKVYCLNGIKVVTQDDDLSQYNPGAVVLIDFSYNKTVFEIYWSDGEQDNEASRKAYKEFLKMLETIKFINK